MILESHYALYPLRRLMMIRWLLDWYENCKFNREFEKKKKELLKKDPFIYDFTDDDKKN